MRKRSSASASARPGNIEPRSGAVLYSPNFKWTNAPLGETLRAHFDMPVFVGNDARCATLGEYTYGMGRGTRNFVLLTLGHRDRRRNRCRRRSDPGQPLRRGRGRPPSDSPDRRLRVQLRQDRLL